MTKRPIDHFKDAMNRESVIAALSRTTVDVDKFIRISVQLIENKPNLLSVDDPESLIAALIECAGYGFYPNGDEGYVEISNNKIGDGVWKRIARFELTTSGIRSIAARHDVLIHANIVHQNDIFRHEEGDEPCLEHVINWGHQDGRGDAYLVYAVFKHKDGTILHREVMDKEMIEAVQDKSRNKKGMLWNEFWSEGWKKSVIRRGSKTVKLSPEVEGAAKQIDRDYSFGEAVSQKKAEPDPTPEPDEVEEPPRQDGPPDEVLPDDTPSDDIPEAEAKEVRPPRKTRATRKTAPRKTTKKPEPKPEPEPEPEPEKEDDPEPAEQDYASMSREEVDAAWDNLEDDIMQATSIAELEELYKRNKGFLDVWDADDVLVELFAAQKSSLK